MNANKRLIGVSVLVVAGTITLAEIQRHEKLPGPDQWIGLAMAYFVVSVLADLRVPVAGGLAMLMMVATLLVRGDEALAFAMDSQGRERRKRLRGEQRGERRRRRAPRQNLEPVEPGSATIWRGQSASVI